MKWRYGTSHYCNSPHPGDVPWRGRSHFSSLVGSGSSLDITAHVFAQRVEQCWCERNEYRGCCTRMTTWFYGASLYILSANCFFWIARFWILTSSLTILARFSKIMYEVKVWNFPFFITATLLIREMCLGEGEATFLVWWVLAVLWISQHMCSLSE